jgi:hypothetical protein
MNLLGSNRFIYIGFRISWQMIYGKNERSMQGPCCHSCMLPNGTTSIILWLVMSHGFSSIHYHIACVRYREMMWSQNRDMIFRAKSLCLRLYGIPAASMLSTDSQIISKWTASISRQIYLFRSNNRSFLEEGRCMKDDLWFISTIALFTQVDLNRLAWRTQYSPYATPTVFTWPSL